MRSSAVFRLLLVTALAGLLAFSGQARAAPAESAPQANATASNSSVTNSSAAAPTNSSTVQAVVEAGESAGAAAGAAAGSVAGASAGLQAATGQFSEKLSDSEFAALAEKNRGAAQFFTDVDKDGNHHWSQAEWANGIRLLQERRMIPVPFDTEGAWLKQRRNIDNELNFKDFLQWASGTAARAPPPGTGAATAANAAAVTAETAASKAQDCATMFKTYDKDQSGSLSADEFHAAMQGRYDDSKLDAAYTDLDRKGAGGTLQLTEFSQFCTKLTGLPSDATQANAAAAALSALAQDPCKGDPCASVQGTICQPDPKQCLTLPCPQYKCVNDDSSGAGNSTAKSPKSPYGKCAVLFDAWDNNGKDGKLTYGEFERGVEAAKKNNKIAPTFPTRRAWEALEHPNDQLDIYEFVHFCLALSNGETEADTVDQECFQVFSHWDRNPRDMRLNKREFVAGMRRAKRQGHLDANLKIGTVWNDLAKVNGEVEPGPFVDFCRAASTGAEPEAAAKDTQAPRPPAPDTSALNAEAMAAIDAALAAAADAGNATAAQQLQTNATVAFKPVTNETVAANSSGLNNVGQAVSVPTDKYCTGIFLKADQSHDGTLSPDEFKFACPEVVSGDQCTNYTVIFGAFESTGKNQMTMIDFVRLCKSGGNKTMVDSITVDAVYLKKITDGAAAGAAAGARAGAAAGRDAGLVAGTQAAQNEHLRALQNANEALKAASAQAALVETDATTRRRGDDGGDEGSGSDGATFLELDEALATNQL